MFFFCYRILSRSYIIFSYFFLASYVYNSSLVFVLQDMDTFEENRSIIL